MFKNAHTFARRHGARIAAGAASLGAAAGALAQTDPTTGVAAVQSLSGTAAEYGPPMFGLAIAAVGIMIAIKWIKRAKGAA